MNEPYEKPSLSSEPKAEGNKEIMWSIRIFTLVIIAAVLISELMDIWASRTPQVVIMTMSLLILAWSFRPLLKNNKRMGKWVTAGLVVVLLVGILLFFLFGK